MIPQFDLKKEYSLLENKIQTEIRKVFSKTNFIQGENVKEFEEKVANYIGVKYAISCNSGTDALHFALRSLNIGVGDEVITTPFTFISTIEAIMYLGAKPVFADINKRTYNISKSEILKKITSNTKAIIPVHLFGNPFDVEDLKKDIDNNFINIIDLFANYPTYQYITNCAHFLLVIWHKFGSIIMVFRRVFKYTHLKCLLSNLF